MLARLFSFVFLATLAGLVVGAVRAGPHRVACPECFALTEIAPAIWTDRPDQADRYLALVNQAQGRVAAFFGGPSLQPNIILCATKSCATAFGIRGNGLSVAHMAILVSPGGLTLGTLTHELTHFRLHRALGPWNIVQQPFPTWFDEGLATHVAGHPRWRGDVTPAMRARVRKVAHFWQWDDAYRAIGVGPAYATAATEVAEIEQHIGRTGLLELINRAEDGEPFERVLKELRSR